MWRVRFWEVDGEEMNADGGFIEVANDGTVTMPTNLSFIATLRAPVDPRDMASASTRPTGGFETVGEVGGKVAFRAVGAWDPDVWIDKVRYHFRTPYLRPGDVEIDPEPEEAGVGVATDRPSGLLDPRAIVGEPGDMVDPVDYWWATNEGWDDIPPDEQDDILRNLGLAHDQSQSDGDPPETTTE